MPTGSEGRAYDSPAAAVLPRRGGGRLVLRRRRVAADGAAEPLGPGPQARGRAGRRRCSRAPGAGSRSTEAGRMLRPHAERTLADAEEAADSVRQVRTLTGGTVSFGTFGSAHHSLLGGLIQDFRRRHPDVRVRVVGQNSVEVADAVRDGGLEAGLVALPVDDGGLELRPSIQEEQHYVSASPQRLRRPVTIEALAAAPLILYDARWGAGRPDAPPARRAGAARRRADRAADRGRVPHRGARPRGPPARRHDRRPRRPGDPRLRAHARQRVARSAAPRHVRVRHAPQRASLPGDPRVHGARGAAHRRDGRSARSEIRSDHVARSRHRRRRGVPADHLLAAGGRAAR